MHAARLPRSYARLPYLIAATVVGVVCVFGAALYAVDRYLVARTGEALAVIAAEIADQLDHTLFERYGDINVAAGVLAPSMHDAAAVDRYIHLIEEAYSQYRWVGVTDAQGR